jgi:integrase
MALTDTAIRAAKPREKPYRITDGAGLALQINPDGTRGWRFRYRFQGREQLLSFGPFPDISLRRAREKRKAARDQLDQGINPSAHRKAQRVSHALTFERIAAEWLSTQKKLAQETRDRMESWLDFVNKHIGPQPIASIEPPELLSVLRRIESRGKHETAHRTLAVCGRVFRYAIATGRATRDISADLRGALAIAEKSNFAAITEPRKVGELLRAIDGYRGQPSTEFALRLAPHVFVRPGELRGARWDEFEFDPVAPAPGEKEKITDPQWRIPAARMKQGEQHIVPLSRQAVAILRGLYPLSGPDGFLFPSVRNSSRCMSENTINAALRGMGFTQEEMTGHGFRHMASTLLHERGYRTEWIERQLSHGDRNRVRAAYNFAEHLPERRKMMQEWSDYLDALRIGGNVVSFRVKSA